MGTFRVDRSESPPPPHRLPRNTKLLIAVRGLRSVGQGALVVDFALYLHALAWRGTQIGALLSAALLFNVVVTLVVGRVSDRFGRKAFLLAYEVVQLAAAGLALASSQGAFIAIATVIGGFGRGANGAAGPFGPVEQAWLGVGVAREERGNVYSLNSAVGLVGMGIGALLAALPSLWSGMLPGANAFRPLFGIVVLGSAGALVLLAFTREDRTRARLRGGSTPYGRAEPERRDRENGRLLFLVGLNALNGVAIGLVGSLLAYWFVLRYHVGPAAVAPVLAVSFIFAGLSSAIVGRLSRRFGSLPMTIVLRSLGLGFLVLTPLAPTFALAASCNVLRAMANQSTGGTRLALAIGLVGEERRGFAACLNAVSIAVPRALGPLAAGALFDAHQFVLPFMIAALFQAAYLVLLPRLFGASERIVSEGGV